MAHDRLAELRLERHERGAGMPFEDVDERPCVGDNDQLATLGGLEHEPRERRQQVGWRLVAGSFKIINSGGRGEKQRSGQQDVAQRPIRQR